MADNIRKKDKEGIFISIKLLVLILVVIAIAYIATVLGLVFGLRGPTIINFHKEKVNNVSTTTSSSSVTVNQDIVSDVINEIENKTTEHVENPTPFKLGYRLPDDLLPFYYNLNISVETGPKTEPIGFYGSVQIYFYCFKATNFIVLHARIIKIESILLFDANRINVTQNIEYSKNEQKEILILKIDKQLEANRNYSILIKYIGKIFDDDFGIFRNSYFDKNGEERWIIGSQLQPIDARRVFPCFDEPAMKARFKLTVKHHRDFTEVISNMPIVAKRNMTDGYIETEFDETVPMSTYILAVVISDFKCKSAVANAGLSGKIDVRVCARPNAFDQLDYALKTAVSLIEFYEKYFGLKYPLPKIDHVALPEFPNGMENWGLIIYGENMLLFNAEKKPLIHYNVINSYISHEIAHNWFGNQVTPKWWNHIWLNEAITTYMEYIGLHGVNKNLLMAFEQFVEKILNSLERDSKLDTFPIVSDYNERFEIKRSFDGDITYQKGSIIIRMMNYVLSNETFTIAINKYLQKYKYGAVTEEDFFNCLQKQVNHEGKVNIDVASVMKTWLYQPGYPLINVTTVSSNSIKLTQQRYNKYSLEYSAKNKEKWYVPFSYSIEKINVENVNTSKSNMSNLYSRIVWMKPEEEQKIIILDEQLDKNSFILANLDFAGYFRVNYDENNWNMIIKQLKTNVEAIPVKNRAQLIDDSFNFVKSGILKIDKSLQLISYMANETDYLPWIAAIKHFKYILSMIEDTDVYDQFQEYLIKLMTNAYDEVKWDEANIEIWTDKLLRKQLLSFACKIGFKECVNKSTALFSEWMKNKSRNPIKPFYQTFVYCTAVRYGTALEWHFALDQLLSTEDKDQKEALFLSLTCTEKPWLIKKLVDMFLNKQIGLKTYTNGFFDDFRLSGHALAVVLNHLKEQNNTVSIPLIFLLVIDSIKYEYQLKEFKNTFDEEEHGEEEAVSYSGEDSMLHVKQNIKWLKLNLDEIRLWFKREIPAI